MQYGEIINLGRHKLMCGDATKFEDVEKLIADEKIDLVLTDPPYGNRKIQHKNGEIGGRGINNPSGRKNPSKYEAKKHEKIYSNDSTEAARKNYDLIKNLTERKIIWGGHYYTDFLPPSPGWIFWDKCVHANDFGDGELAWVSNGTKIKYYAFLWNGMLRKGSLVLNPKPRVHPTQKPVELHAKILEDFSNDSNTVLDCFGGSGTTLIACEVTNRKCLMMELSSKYCEIIKARYEKLREFFPLFSSIS